MPNLPAGTYRPRTDPESRRRLEELRTRMMDKTLREMEETRRERIAAEYQVYYMRGQRAIQHLSRNYRQPTL